MGLKVILTLDDSNKGCACARLYHRFIYLVDQLEMNSRLQLQFCSILIGEMQKAIKCYRVFHTDITSDSIESLLQKIKCTPLVREDGTCRCVGIDEGLAVVKIQKMHAAHGPCRYIVYTSQILGLKSIYEWINAEHLSFKHHVLDKKYCGENMLKLDLQCGSLKFYLVDDRGFQLDLHNPNAKIGDKNPFSSEGFLEEMQACCKKLDNAKKL